MGTDSDLLSIAFTNPKCLASASTGYLSPSAFPLHPQVVIPKTLPQHPQDIVPSALPLHPQVIHPQVPLPQPAQVIIPSALPQHPQIIIPIALPQYPQLIILILLQVMILSLIDGGALTRVAGNGPTKTRFFTSPSIVLNSFPHNQLSRTCSDQVDRRYFEPSLDVSSLRSDVISVHTILSLYLLETGWDGENVGCRKGGDEST